MMVLDVNFKFLRASILVVCHAKNRRLFRRLLIPPDGFWWSKKVIKSGRIRFKSLFHAGSRGSNPLGDATESSSRTRLCKGSGINHLILFLFWGTVLGY